MTRQELKNRRKQLGLTQQELAARLGITRNSLNRWEMGKHPISPAMEKLIRLVCQNK